MPILDESASYSRPSTMTFGPPQFMNNEESVKYQKSEAEHKERHFQPSILQSKQKFRNAYEYSQVNLFYHLHRGIIGHGMSFLRQGEILRRKQISSYIN